MSNKNNIKFRKVKIQNARDLQPKMRNGCNNNYQKIDYSWTEENTVDITAVCFGQTVYYHILEIIKLSLCSTSVINWIEMT